MIADPLQQQVAALLANFNHPTLQRDLKALRAVRQVTVQADGLHITLTMPFVWQQPFSALQQAKTALLCRTFAVPQVVWHLHYQIAPLRVANSCTAIPRVGNILAVTSNKGGVGKSLITVNLALALAAEGARVGIFDGDLYGPSLAGMLGIQVQAAEDPPSTVIPQQIHGLAVHSLGYLLADPEAVIWRGPMASRVLLQLLQETMWPELDYLLIDMPPGTGDLHLTLAQQVPITAVIVVTTPQLVSLNDTRRGITLFSRMGIPILGIVENMHHIICCHCGQRSTPFGIQGARQLAHACHIPLLGQLAFHDTLCAASDTGIPLLIAQPEGEIALWFRQLAVDIAARLYWQGEPMLTSLAVASSCNIVE